MRLELILAALSVLLATASFDAASQGRDVLVTELQGAVTRGSRPVERLEALKVGDRIRVAPGASASVFHPDSAQLYSLKGPVSFRVTAKGLEAEQGEMPAPKHLEAAYRGLRVKPADLQQGSLVMRTTPHRGPRIVAPEGAVSEPQARQLEWAGEKVAGARVQVVDETGTVIHEAPLGDGPIALPPAVKLVKGKRYSWAILPLNRAQSPVDWTEFIVMDGAPRAPGREASPSERVLYAAWLQQHDLARAANRQLLRVGGGA